MQSAFSLLLSMRNCLGDYELGKPLSDSQRRGGVHATDYHRL